MHINEFTFVNGCMIQTRFYQNKQRKYTWNNRDCHRKQRF